MWRKGITRPNVFNLFLLDCRYSSLDDVYILRSCAHLKPSINVLLGPIRRQESIAIPQDGDKRVESKVSIVLETGGFALLFSHRHRAKSILLLQFFSGNRASSKTSQFTSLSQPTFISQSTVPKSMLFIRKSQYRTLLRFLFSRESKLFLVILLRLWQQIRICLVIVFCKRTVQQYTRS